MVTSLCDFEKFDPVKTHPPQTVGRRAWSRFEGIGAEVGGNARGRHFCSGWIVSLSKPRLDQIFSLSCPLVLGSHLSVSLRELVAPLSDALLFGRLLAVVLEGAQLDVDLITQSDPAGSCIDPEGETPLIVQVDVRGGDGLLRQSTPPDQRRRTVEEAVVALVAADGEDRLGLGDEGLPATKFDHALGRKARSEDLPGRSSTLGLEEDLSAVVLGDREDDRLIQICHGLIPPVGVGEDTSTYAKKPSNKKYTVLPLSFPSHPTVLSFCSHLSVPRLPHPIPQPKIQEPKQEEGQKKRKKEIVIKRLKIK